MLEKITLENHERLKLREGNFSTNLFMTMKRQLIRRILTRSILIGTVAFVFGTWSVVKYGYQYEYLLLLTLILLLPFMLLLIITPFSVLRIMKAEKTFLMKDQKGLYIIWPSGKNERISNSWAVYNPGGAFLEISNFQKPWSNFYVYGSNAHLTKIAKLLTDEGLNERPLW